MAGDLAGPGPSRAVARRRTRYTAMTTGMVTMVMVTMVTASDAMAAVRCARRAWTGTDAPLRRSIRRRAGAQWAWEVSNSPGPPPPYVAHGQGGY
jgi:hypothetical protein